LLWASIFNFEYLDILRDSIGHPSKTLLSFEFAQSFCIQFLASRYITRLNRTSKFKVIVVWICYELPFSILSVLIYNGTQSDIQVKSICHLHLLKASVFNFERLNILRDSIGHPSSKLLSFEFAASFNFQFRASWYITGHNRTSKWKVIVVRICSQLLYFERLNILRESIGHPRKNVIVVRIFSQLLYSISSFLIYYGTQSDIQVKSYCHLNLLRASVFNFERLNILRDSFGHPRKKLLSLEFSHSFCIQFRPSRYITGLNKTSE